MPISDRRSPMKIFLARLTLAAFVLTLPGSREAWSQVARSAGASSAAGISGVSGAVLAAPAAAPLSTLSILPTATLAAPSAIVSAPIAAAVAAPAAAVTTLRSIGTRSAALAAPESSAADGKAASAKTFDAAAARPANASDAVSGSLSASVSGLSAAQASAPRALVGVPAPSRWTSRAKSYLPAVLLAAGAGVLAYALQHFGITPAAALAPFAFLGVTIPQGGAEDPAWWEKMRKLASAYDASLSRTSKSGQLLTAEDLQAVGSRISYDENLTTHVVGMLASDGRLARLSGEGGDRYIYTEVPERSKTASGDTEVDKAYQLAKTGLDFLNGSPRLDSHALAVASLGQSLKVMRAKSAPGSTEMKIVFKNAAYELLRDVLREYQVKLEEKQEQQQISYADEIASVEKLRRRLMNMHFGLGVQTESFDLESVAKLEELLGNLKPSHRYTESRDDGQAIAAGLGMLYAFVTQGRLPEDKPAAPLALPAPKDGAAVASQTDAMSATDFKPLPQSEYQTLMEYGTDITQKAADGKMRPLIGRRAEIRQMVKALLRVEKNNPLVIGSAGVGKTAVVNGLAQMIVAGDIPELEGKNIIQIDLNKVVAGTQYRGQFEERMQKIIDEAKKSNGRVVLFLDEIHKIVGAGDSKGGNDASQILKESLSDGSLTVIGATTTDEYRRIEKDGALMRRFNPVKLLPPTKEEAEEILTGVKGAYEAKHKVTIGEKAVKAAVALAARYVTDRHLPDSALDLIDDAAAEVELKASEAKAAGKEEGSREVTQEDLAAEIALRTGVPAGKVSEGAKERLKRLPDELKGQVIGQDEAVAAVARAVQRGRLGYRDPKQPIAKFAFLGPTGVGKTELARALAKMEFGSEKNMLRLDMSEYQEKHAISRLISAPPGYVGHDEGGQLTEPVRRNPYQVILFDEIEKAHPDVFDVLLQVLEDGRLTDSQGRTVDFSNTIIIMTSNIGGSLAAQEEQTAKKRPMGFITDEEKPVEKKAVETEGAAERKAKYLQAFKEKYRPEFVNRLGMRSVLVFNELSSKDQMNAILDLRLGELERQLKDKKMTVALTDKARAYALDKALSQKQYGARPIKQMVTEEMNDALKDADLDGRIGDGDAVLIDWDVEAGRFRADRRP